MNCDNTVLKYKIKEFNSDDDEEKCSMKCRPWDPGIAIPYTRALTSILNTHTHTHTPVSYTHLDVYKRQHVLTF